MEVHGNRIAAISYEREFSMKWLILEEVKTEIKHIRVGTMLSKNCNSLNPLFLSSPRFHL